MNWSDKANVIADEIIKKMKKDDVGGYTRDEIIEGLKKAAYQGMQFECDNWLMNKTK